MFPVIECRNMCSPVFPTESYSSHLFRGEILYYRFPQTVFYNRTCESISFEAVCLFPVVHWRNGSPSNSPTIQVNLERITMFFDNLEDDSFLHTRSDNRRVQCYLYGRLVLGGIGWRESHTTSPPVQFLDTQRPPYPDTFLNEVMTCAVLRVTGNPKVQ